MARKIVIFADGTGNAFTTQESNVWRLYRALDQSQPDQISYYIPGVGTSGFRPFALLDGATGIGVPSNVRKLYRFLCWNWHADDQIFMFGFSRGSFTIRTLVGLISSEGLLPTIIDGEPVSHGEMMRNSRAAWRSYRAKSIPRNRSLPTIWISRWIRDFLLTAYGAFRHYRSYREIEKSIEDQKRKEIPIEFIGLFDTVEAFGVPFEELRAAIDWAIWPISFRNYRLSTLVKRARHALSLDDERTTFHPIRFDQQDEPKDSQRIKEVWFAGVHSDVGGGYPDDSLEHVPLIWMAEESELATVDSAGNRVINGLYFSPGAIDGFRQLASPFGMCHDSRAGLGVFYRYSPRVIGDAGKDGGPPVVHHSVAEKMVAGTEHYAPIVLPANALVLMPGGWTNPIAKFDPINAAEHSPTPQSKAEAQGYFTTFEQVKELREPNENYVELTRDTVWWRRVAYFVLLLAAAAVLSLPLTASWISDVFNTAVLTTADAIDLLVVKFGGSPLGLHELWSNYWTHALSAEQGISSNLGSVSRTVGGFAPAYLKAYVDVIVAKPMASFVVILIALFIYHRNSVLKDLIADRAHLAWFANVRESRKLTSVERPGFWLSIARIIRTSKIARCVSNLFSQGLIPGAFLLIVFAALVITVSRSTVTFRGAQDKLVDPRGLCNSKGDAVPVLDAPVSPNKLFDTADPCWASGIKVEKGRRYILRLDMVEPYFDQKIVADIAGFGGNWAQTLGLPLRRWWIADWFQPIARIGAAGAVEWPLQAVDGTAPRPFGIDTAGKPMKVPEIPLLGGSLGYCERIPDDQLAAAQAIHRQQAVNRTFISEFTAAASGELFLYVNDAIAAFPYLPTVTCFYGNNRGTARLTIKREPLPQL